MPDVQAWRNAIRSVISRYFEQPVVSAFAAVGMGPNMATFLGVAIAATGAGFAAAGEFVIAGALVLVGGAFDLVDGGLARRAGRVSRQGALLDSVLDRVSEALVLLGLLVHFTSEASFGQTEAILAFVAFAGSIMVSYVRARAEGLGLKGGAGFFTRPERVVVMAGALLAGQPTVLLWILAVGTPLSAIQRFIGVWRLAGQEERHAGE